jgi:tetratricopeptide (TPR) repeat protein
MPHLFWVMCLAAASFPQFAQTPVPEPQSLPRPLPTDPTAVTVEAPRAPLPPPAEASAHELETAGDRLRTEKAFTDAIDYYQAAIRKNDSAVLHNKIGIAYLQMMQLKDADKAFQRAIKMNPKYAEPINNLGVVYYIRKKYSKAIHDYEKALAIDENAASFHSNLGMALFEKKEFEKASAELMRALQLDPDIFRRQAMGGVAAKMASPEDRARYAYTLARIYARQGMFDQSLDYLKKAIEEGYSKIKDVYTDEVFAGLRKDPRFAVVMGKIEPLPN